MQILIGIILLFVIFLLLSVLVVFVFFVIDLFLTEIPYVATKKEKIETIIKLANIKSGQTVIDLGSGDGRLLLESAKKGAMAIGYELNPYLILITIIRAKLNGLAPHIKIYKKNLWGSDLKVANVIFVYGRKKTMQKFQSFVYKNAKKGTRVIVNTNVFPSKKYLKSSNGVYLYKV